MKKIIVTLTLLFSHGVMADSITTCYGSVEFNTRDIYKVKEYVNDLPYLTLENLILVEKVTAIMKASSINGGDARNRFAAYLYDLMQNSSNSIGVKSTQEVNGCITSQLE